MSYYKKPVLLLLIFSFFQLYAQGSGYSRFGIGDLILPHSALSSGRAATGFSLSSSYYPNRLNPAGLNLMKKTTFSADMFYNGFQLTDSKNSNYLSGIKFYGFDLSIPISTSNGLVVNFGLIPYSRVDYTIKRWVNLENNLHNLEHKGDGGLSNVFLASSYNIKEDISVGFRLNYIFGNIYHSITQSSGAYKNEIYRTLRFHNLNGTLGLIYSGFSKLLGLENSHKINFGLALSNKFNLNAEVNRYFNYYSNGNLITQDSLFIEKGQLTVPTAVGFGISYVYEERYQVTSDVYIQDWSKTKLLTDMAGKLRNNVRYSFGFELIPYTGKVSTLRKFGFRAGGFYNQSYINVNSGDINEYGFTAGTDFPIFGDTRLALGFEYSIRGEEKNQKDNIYKLTIGIIGTELWFVRPEEE